MSAETEEPKAAPEEDVSASEPAAEGEEHAQTPEGDEPAATSEGDEPAATPEGDEPAATPDDAPSGEVVGGEVGDGVAGPVEESSEAPTKEAPKEQGAFKTLLALAFVAIAIAGAVFMLPRKVDLIVDNGGGLPIRVFVNGVDEGIVKATDSRVVRSVPAGKVVLEGHEVGPEGQKGRAVKKAEAELTAPLFRQRRRAYVWNVEGQTAGYWIVTFGFGDEGGKNRPPEAWVPPGEVFAIPGRCEPLLDEAPRQITVPSGQTGATRDVLYSSHKAIELQMEALARQRMGGVNPALLAPKEKE